MGVLGAAVPAEGAKAAPDVTGEPAHPVNLRVIEGGRALLPSLEKLLEADQTPQTHGVDFDTALAPREIGTYHEKAVAFVKHLKTALRFGNDLAADLAALFTVA